MPFCPNCNHLAPNIDHGILHPFASKPLVLSWAIQLWRAFGHQTYAPCFSAFVHSSQSHLSVYVWRISACFLALRYRPISPICAKSPPKTCKYFPTWNCAAKRLSANYPFKRQIFMHENSTSKLHRHLADSRIAQLTALFTYLSKKLSQKPS